MTKYDSEATEAVFWMGYLAGFVVGLSLSALILLYYALN